MKFQPGNNANPNGRPKKTVRETQDDLRYMLLEFMKANFSEVLTDLDTMSSKDRIRFYIQLLRHVEPRHIERPPMINLENLSEGQLDEVIQKIIDKKLANEA